METPKPALKFRDLLATPFLILGTWLLLIAATIGGAFTAQEILKFVRPPTNP